MQSIVTSIKKRIYSKPVYVICADPVSSSCIVNAVYTDYVEAKRWVDIKNERIGQEFYWLEQSQLIE